jgi:hypothetical protein
LARVDKKWALNDGQSPNFRVVRVHVSTGYNRVERNRRASRNGRVSSSPTRNPSRSDSQTCASLFIPAAAPLHAICFRSAQPWHAPSPPRARAPDGQDAHHRLDDDVGVVVLLHVVQPDEPRHVVNPCRAPKPTAKELVSPGGAYPLLGSEIQRPICQADGAV